MGLCVCVEPKVSNENAQGFLRSSLVRCFFGLLFCIDISYCLVWFGWFILGGEALKPKTCAPCPAQRGGSLWNSFFVSEATATIKLFWVKWLSCPPPQHGSGCVLPTDVPYGSQHPWGVWGPFLILCWFPMRGFSGQEVPGDTAGKQGPHGVTSPLHHLEPWTSLG